MWPENEDCTEFEGNFDQAQKARNKANGEDLISDFEMTFNQSLLKAIYNWFWSEIFIV